MADLRDWPRTAAALAAGLAVGVVGMAGGALLLYTGDRFLSSVGFLMALALVATAAGVWVGAPDGPQPGHRRVLGRWMLAVAALVVASFVATLWLRSPALQRSVFGPPLALVFLLAEPMYALGALLAALEARRRGWLGERWYALPGRRGRAAGVAVPALIGTAAGVFLSAGWLIPALPPGPVFLGAAMLLAVTGSVEMAAGREAKEGRMLERVVIVTGVGARGQVGYAVAEAFVAAGARVVVTARSPDLEALARDLGEGVVAVTADLTEPADAARVVDAARTRWGRIDALINVAGGLRVMKTIAETEVGDWARELDANARTALVMTRAALPLLRESGGAVVNFTAQAGMRAARGLGAYSAAKASVISLTRALALEEGENGVRVNAVSPGLVDTDQNRADRGDSEQGMVTRKQIAGAVLFLASDAASGITGEVLSVLGGRLS